MWLFCHIRRVRTLSNYFCFITDSFKSIIFPAVPIYNSVESSRLTLLCYDRATEVSSEVQKMDFCEPQWTNCIPASTDQIKRIRVLVMCPHQRKENLRSRKTSRLTGTTKGSPEQYIKGFQRIEEVILFCKTGLIFG